jgi:hypothetical protein
LKELELKIRKDWSLHQSTSRETTPEAPPTARRTIAAIPLESPTLASLTRSGPTGAFRAVLQATAIPRAAVKEREYKQREKVLMVG